MLVLVLVLLLLFVLRSLIKTRSYKLLQVETFTYTMYGDPRFPKAHQYTENILLPYPKVGTKNPYVKILIKDLSNDTSEALEVEPPSKFLDQVTDYIYFRAYWITPEKFGVIWMNRVQNYSSTSECSLNATATAWTCTSVQEHYSPGWLLIQKPLYSSQDYSTFLQIVPKAGKDGLSFQHIAKIKGDKIGSAYSSFYYSYYSTVE